MPGGAVWPAAVAASTRAASLIMQSHLMQRLKKGFIKFLPCALNWWQLLLPILVIALEFTAWTVFLVEIYQLRK